MPVGEPERYVPGSGVTGCLAGAFLGALAWFALVWPLPGWIGLASLVALVALGGAAGARYGDRFIYWYFGKG